MKQKNKNQEQGEKLNMIRHSTSHIMAAAMRRLFPEAKFAIGPTIENGFYYDFDLDEESISESDLEKIESLMEEIIRQKLDFKKSSLNIKEALKLMEDQPYKQELIEELGKNNETEVSFYQVGDFTDLCRGPHVDSTKELGHFKLLSIAGAYWRGDVKNKMLTRIYGTAFASQEELDEYLKNLEEAKKRDHRKIGQDLNLFLIDPVVGMGLPMWLPKGAILWRTMEDFWYKEHLKNGYELVRTPHIGNRRLWEQSGHWNFYNESMYPPIEVSRSLKELQNKIEIKEKEEYLLKPMNCPFHVMLYQSRPHSYRDLPLRWAECGTVYRYEKSGELNGLVRVRGFTQDDAHIICSKEQVAEELKKVIDFIIFMLSAFGFKDYGIYLSLRDPNNKEKYAGNDEGWEFTQKVLEKVAKEKKLDYIRQEGEAAFYGPKIDFKIKDCLNREWQCSTLQFDFNLPEKFDMIFTNKEGQHERPYMLHRALFGSFERFIGVLIEQYAGEFPLWLAPTQVKILPISEKFNAYAQEVADELRLQEIRAEIDLANDTLGKKIRNTEHEKIPYMLILGDKEQSAKKVAVRKRKEGDLGQMDLKSLVERLKKEIVDKK
ncbi:MAG: threonine--tRNA ligase [Patescibacteria group bacterium]